MFTIGQGYLSYTLAGLAVLGAIAGFLLNLLTAEQAIGTVWAGLALLGVRRAIQ